MDTGQLPVRGPPRARPDW